MKYKIYQSSVKQKDREEFNRKLLKLIDNKETEKYGITRDDVYNAYTGDGGLHVFPLYRGAGRGYRIPDGHFGAGAADRDCDNGLYAGGERIERTELFPKA